MKSERQQDDLGGFCSEHGARGTELGLPVFLASWRARHVDDIRIRYGKVLRCAHTNGISVCASTFSSNADYATLASPTVFCQELHCPLFKNLKREQKERLRVRHVVLGDRRKFL